MVKKGISNPLKNMKGGGGNGPNNEEKNNDEKIVHVNNEVVEYSGKLLTYGLVSCMAVFWHYKNKNYLIHASERRIYLRNSEEHMYHPLIKAFGYISQIPEKIDVYIYSAMRFFDEENKFLQKYDDKYNILKMHYDPHRLIGLTKEGKLIDIPTSKGKKNENGNIIS